MSTAVIGAYVTNRLCYVYVRLETCLAMYILYVPTPTKSHVQYA